MPNSPIAIHQDQVAVFSVTGADAAGKPADVKAGTATISDYGAAYVAATATPNEYMIVIKSVLTVGETKPIRVSFQGTATDGSKVQSFDVSFELDGAPVPVATQFVLGNVNVIAKGSVPVPSDPGSDTISFPAAPPPVV